MPTSPPSYFPGEGDTVIARQAMGRVRVATKPVPIWPMVLVIYATLLPREISIHLGDNFIYMDRLALAIAMPFVAYYLWHGTIKFVLPDWLILFLGIWMVVALWQVHGADRAIVSGLSFAFDAVAGYYLARISFRSLDDMRRVLIWCAPGFFLAGFSLAAESLSHTLIVRPFFAKLYGGLHYSSGTDNIDSVIEVKIRYGLMRAYGPWIHPIEAGLHMATLLAIYWKSGIRGWPLWLALFAVSTVVFTVSSAALLTLVATIAMLIYDWMTRHVRELSWPPVFIALVFAIVSISIFSKSGPIGLFIRFATLDPSTGYFRVAIWQFASMSALAHPWFGIGFNAYRRPDWMFTSSIDTHWLLYAVRFGFPAVAALMLACISALAGLVRAEKMANRADAGFYRGIAMSLGMLVLMGFSVAYQGGTLTWFTILLGGCVACAQHTYVVNWAFWIRRKPRIA